MLASAAGTSISSHKVLSHEFVECMPPWPGKPYTVVCPHGTPQSVCNRLGGGSTRSPSCAEPEAETAEVLNSFLFHCRGCEYIDVGCNIGYFALQAAALGARVECYEPNGAYTAASRAAVSLNGFGGRVSVRRAAVVASGNGPPTLNFSHSYPPCGIGKEATEHLLRAGGGSFSAPTIPIETILRGRQVTLLKMDIDSIEGALLNTVVKMLASAETNVTTIVAELGDNEHTVKWFDCVASASLCRRAEAMRGGHFNDIWRLQHELGFDVYRLNIHNGRDIFDWRGQNVHTRMAGVPAGLDDLYQVRSMRKLEKLRPDTPVSSYPDLLSSGVSLLFTRVQLAEVATHHVLDVKHAFGVTGNPYTAATQTHLNRGNPVWFGSR